MKLVDMNIREYLDLLKSNAPAPGGGSACALSGAQGMALTLMVAELTVGKEKYAEHEELNQKAIEDGTKLFEDLARLIDLDTEAFTGVSNAYKLPKETEEEKAARSAEIQKASLYATEIPFEVMVVCYKALQITSALVGKSNKNAASDLGVAALNLYAAIKGAWMNVKINLPSLKDFEKEMYFQDEGIMIIRKGQDLANNIYADVIAEL